MTLDDVSEEEVKQFNELLKILKRFSEGGINECIEKPILVLLENTIPFFSNLVITDVFEEVKRITINRNVVGSNKRIHNISQLKYPPVEKVTKYGRCNLPKQSVLYSTFLKFTALSEMKPKIGDLISVTTWRVKNNQELIYSPIFKNQPIDISILNPRTFEINQVYKMKLKEYPPYLQQKIDALLQFVTDEFTKKVNSQNHFDYIFSAFFSNKIFNEFENGNIEAIYYPSVQAKLSFENLAIKAEAFETKYLLAEVHESIVIGDPSNGKRGYMMEGISDCNSFDYTTGKIFWENGKFYQSDEHIHEIKKAFNVDFNED